MASSSHQPAASLSELPPDELARYAAELGLRFERNAAPGEMVRLIRRTQELLLELERDALIDVVVWARRPVRQNAGKEELAREIAKIQRTNYQALSTRGLVAYARLRGHAVSASDNAEEIIDRLRRQDGIWKRLSAVRRSWVGSVVTHLFEGGGEDSGEYRFLPDDAGQRGDGLKDSLKSQVEEHGLVGGIASRLRGAADEYLRLKMDEIESRIDAKLEQIDQRLAEWRDREVANRLRILRITLIFTVLVAVLSLGYNYLNTRIDTATSIPASAADAATD